MTTETPPPFNPLSKSDLEKRARILAGNAGFPKQSPEEDAFRHAYTAAMMTKYHLGGTLTEGFGYLVEAGGLIRNLLYSIGSVFSNELKADTWDTALSEMYKDLVNNEKGISIGQTATDEEDIIRQVSEQIRNGSIISNSSDAYDHYQRENSSHKLENTGNWRPGTGAPMNFVAGDGMWEDAGASGAGLDARAIEALFGRNRGGRGAAIGQMVITSAAALAREIKKSRRNALEGDLIDLLGGGRQPHRTPPIIPDGGGQGVPDILGGVFERIIGGAFNRVKTRTTSRESDRSQDYARAWNTSQSQQQAMLAQWMQQGNRNL